MHLKRRLSFSGNNTISSKTQLKLSLKLAGSVEISFASFSRIYRVKTLEISIINMHLVIQWDFSDDLAKNSTHIVPQPPYIPDLATCNF